MTILVDPLCTAIVLMVVVFSLPSIIGKYPALHNNHAIRCPKARQTDSQQSAHRFRLTGGRAADTGQQTAVQQ